MKRWLVPWSAILVLSLNLLNGCAAKTVKPHEATAVNIQKVQITELPSAESYLGKVIPYIQTSISPEISGILSAVNVRVGDYVQTGQILASINTDQLQVQRAQAQASQEVAQSQLGATEQNSVTALTQAKAALDTAQTGLSNAQSSGAAAVSNAEKVLDAAFTQLSNAKIQDQNSLSEAQANVDSAQAGLEAAKVAAQTAQESAVKAQDALDTAKLALDSAEQTSHSLNDPKLLTAQSAYDQAAIALQSAQGGLANANSGVRKAQAAYDAAQTALQAAQKSLAVSTTQAQVNQAQSSLEAAKTNSDNGVSTAQAQLNQARKNYETLLNNPQLQVSAAQVQAAQAGVQVVQTQINNGQVTSPLSGYVVALDAQVGQVVGPQGGFLSIAALDPLLVSIDVPESDMVKMAVGQKMDVFIPAFQETLSGQVSAIHPAPDANGKYSVEIAVHPGKHILLSGIRVEAYRVGSGGKGIVIPADSVMTLQSGALSVFVVEDGVAHSQDVNIGAMTGSVYEITSGLKEGQELVVKGQNLLSDGDKVKVVDSVTP